MKHAAYILLFFIAGGTMAQPVEDFLKPSDSLNLKRRNASIITVGAASVLTYAALSETWYSDYPRTDFHFTNDNAQWLQMDKAGHVFASYHFSRFGSDILEWSGTSKKNRLIYGAGFGFVFISAIEILDGYSAQWGASLGDIGANAGGSLLFISQELLWDEQRIIPKFSFHTTEYASARPNVLGSSIPEQILKDYNGQTYWLSANIHSFTKDKFVPKWLNVAIGYGAEGMITGDDALVNSVFFETKERTRQFYLGFDVDLQKIKTNSHLLKTIFSVFNSVKVPAPTLEINAKGRAKFHIFYF